MRKILAVFLLFAVYACNPPPVENVYRKESRLPLGYDVPVALLVAEWGGKPRVMGSTWLIDGGNGSLFSARHVTDLFMGNVIELGANECKVFLGIRVFSCLVVQVPPLRDAVVLKMIGSFKPAELPKPYKISTAKLKVGDDVFIQGFHIHPSVITRSNLAEGYHDLIVPILKTFYQIREADPSVQREVVLDNLEATVVDINAHFRINNQKEDPFGELKFQANEYIKVVTTRNHKFSFGGLSGGVVIKVNDQGVSEAVGIITAEVPERLEYYKNGQLKGVSARIVVSDTILVTPIESVKDLYDYARQIR